MKKLAFGLGVAGMLGLAALWLFRGSSGGAGLEPAGILPDTTVGLLEIPDPEGSAERWAGTALARIAAEPEMKAFLERPLSRLGSGDQLSGALPKIWKLKPRRLFAALLSVEGTRPRWIAGFEFRGTREELEAAIADARQAVLQRRPAGKAELVRHGEVPIETFTDGSFVLCSAVVGSVYLIANDPAELRRALDRLRGQGEGTPLAGSGLRKRALEALPRTVEARSYLRPGPLADRFMPLVAAASPGLDEEQIEALRALEVIAAATAFDGVNLRDTIYVGQSAGARAATGDRPAGLKQPLRAYASSQTVLLLASAVDWPARVEVPAGSPDPLGLFEWLRRMLPQLASRGLGLDRLGEAFGSEAGVLIEWSPSAFQPSLLGSVEIRNATLAGQYCEALFANPASGLLVQRERAGSADLYVFSTGGRVRVSPALAVTPERLLFGLDATRLKAVVAGGPAPASGSLETSEAFRRAMGQAGEADRTLAYLDLKALFERAYGLGRPVLLLGAGLMPSVGHYIDASKLPGTETVSKHLGPVVFSQRTVADGLLIESSGPLTLNQLLFGGVVIGGYSATRGYLRH